MGRKRTRLERIGGKKGEDEGLKRNKKQKRMEYKKKRGRYRRVQKKGGKEGERKKREIKGK